MEQGQKQFLLKPGSLGRTRHLATWGKRGTTLSNASTSCAKLLGDGKNSPTENVVVLAKDYAYTIENIALDPIAILLMLHIHKSDAYAMEGICGEDVDWLMWLESEQLLQVAVDNFILAVLGDGNQRNADLEYCSGLTLKTDSRYLMCGSELEGKVLGAYPQLKSFIKNGSREKDLKYSVVKNSMIGLGRGGFIPRYFKDAFLKLQGK